jgi:uncharacterized delta-60 repeat protein
VLALTAGFLLVEFALALPTLANGGRLDQSFSVDGKARVQSLLPQAVAFQADGKIVVGGSEQFPDHAPWFAVARLGADGRLDPTFGGDGIVSKPFGARLGCYGIVYSVAVEPDGKIVATGSSCGGAITVARFNPDGTLDVGFGDAGKVFIEGVGTCRVNAYGIAGALGVRGRIAVAGWGACGGTSSSFTVIAIRHDGTLDPNFSGDGLAEVSVQKGVFGTAIGKGPIAGVVVQPDGKIVIAGSAQYYCPPEGECYSDFAVFRFLSSGTLDQGFGHGDGAVTTKFPGPRCGGGGEAEGLALQPDGKIVVGGLAGCTAGPGTGSHPRWALIRYQANGTLDPDFGGGDGRVVSILLKEEGGDAMYGGLALQANGKIVGAGNLNSPLGGYFALARYRTDGRPDQTFGHHGMVQIVGWGTAWAVAIQADGKIVAVGDGVARFLPS